MPQSKFERPRTGKIWDFIYEANLVGDDLYDEYFTHTAAEEEHPDPSQFTLALHQDPKMQAALKKHEEITGVGHEQGVQNIMSHFLSAHDMAQNGPEEGSHLYHRGMGWYKEFHNTARMITGGHIKPGQNHVEGGDPHLGAGLLAAYSPKTNLGTNQRLAAEAFRLGRGIGGSSGLPDKNGNVKPRDPHSVPGFGAMRAHADKANKLLGVEHDDAHPGNWKRVEPKHWSEVIPNESSVKTHNFTSNTAHGGQNHAEVAAFAKKGIDGRRVTVDDQALSVYLGRPATDKEHSDLTSGGKMPGHPDAFRYNHIVASAYREANNRLVAHGHNVSPEQTQAVTWEHYRAAHPEENDGSPEAIKAQKQKETQAKVSAAGFKKWRGYVGEHFKDHEEAPHSKLGHKLAYGETKAPQDVDTLRPENCTVCGNSTAYDGTQCQVCGYVAPPRPFGDPDVDTAKSKDIRKQVLDSADGTADPNDPDQQLGNQIGDPGELQDQADDAQAQGVSPAITCTNCGTGIIPTPAKSEGDTPPYPAEGDVCPVCKKGELLSQSDPDEDADQDGVPDEEEDAEVDPDAGNNPNVPFGKNKDIKNKDKDKKGK